MCHVALEQSVMDDRMVGCPTCSFVYMSLTFSSDASLIELPIKLLYLDLITTGLRGRKRSPPKTYVFLS